MVILLVEKNKIASEESGTNEQKRKAIKELTPAQAKQVASMLPMRSSSSTTPANPAIDNPSQCINEELTEAQRIQQKKDEYLKADHTKMKSMQVPKSKGKRRSNMVEVGTLMYDFINPQPTFACWCAVLDAYFDNNKRCKSP